MSPVRHILPAVLLVCLLASCSGKPRIIPRNEMTDIYAEMFLADQWLADHPSERKRVDTMLFYDPIFERYGYTFEDYDASVKHYLKDPERYSRIFRDASAKLKKGREKYLAQMKRLEEVREFNSAIKGYSSSDFEKDTLLWRSAYKDSLRHMAIIQDSIIRDSIIRDSIIRDSIVRDSLVRDSLRLEKEKPLRKKKLQKRLDAEPVLT
ncbi:MAG: DUF4296 domain-containing protein [Bacteroidales bacterium]|nr:DUF4296 domain-containing protein [Bacteroidales bacterium]